MKLIVDCLSQEKDKYTSVLKNISISNTEFEWELHLKQDKSITQYDGRCYIQFQFEAPDNDTYDLERQYCRKWYLSKHMTATEIVRTVWKAYEAALMHEAAEKFKYKNVAIYNPHRNVEYLVSIGNNIYVRH